MSLDPETRKLMEKLLLRGERMLGETCPVCGTPLFLIKELGLRFCPKCKRYVIKSEEEYEKALAAGIKPADMIIVGFKPKELKGEERIPERRTSKTSKERARSQGYPPQIEELLDEVVRLVREGKFEEARVVAEIISILCSCFKRRLFSYCMRILVLACGASGLLYTDTLLKVLKDTEHTVELMYSPNVMEVAKHEGINVSSRHSLVDIVHPYSLSAPPCSGSYKIDVTIAMPCSVKTMCSAAYGIVGDPISRALFVSLKERRRTVVVFRETPMTISMVECIRNLLLEGAIVSPASPGFYLNIKTIDEAVRFFVQRVLDRAGIKIDVFRRRGDSSQQI